MNDMVSYSHIFQVPTNIFFTATKVQNKTDKTNKKAETNIPGTKRNCTLTLFKTHSFVSYP
jgi:hypothetical protein